MKLEFKNLLIAVSILLASCAGNKPTTANETIVSELKYWDTSGYFQRKLFGKVVITASGEVTSPTVLTINDNTTSSAKRHFTIGLIEANESYELALAQGNYTITVWTKPSLFAEGVFRNLTVQIAGGEIIKVIALKEKIVANGNDLPQPDKVVKGTIHFTSEIDTRINPNFHISYNLNVKSELKPVSITVVGSSTEPAFKLNGNAISYESKGNSNYKFSLPLAKGDNEITAEATNLAKEKVTKRFIVHIKTDKELEQERKFIQESEKKKLEDERMKKLQLEKEAKAKKAEDDRLAREGDGSPDDLACKKYGLKPQTQGYAECRMRLDLSNKEVARIQSANAASTKAREDAKQAELQRRYDEEQRQQAIIANRESKCQFVKAQEYARPVLGGFLQSMQNANSAYENCMAGVPQINTTCTKDAMGSISCVSR